MSELIKKFFSGQMPDEERLEMLDDAVMVELICNSLSAKEGDSTTELSDQKVNLSNFEKIEKLFVKGEFEFAMDMITGLRLDESLFSQILEGGRIDQNGRPWPSKFCNKIKESSVWGWQDSELRWYELFGTIFDLCPSDEIIDASLWKIDSLNLRDRGSYGFFNKVRVFPDLLFLATDRNLDGLAEKCPKLKFIDFRRWLEWKDNKLDLTKLSGCFQLEEINLCYHRDVSLKDLPTLTNLKRLDLRWNWNLENLDELPNLDNLEDLDVGNCSRLLSVGDLSRFPFLQRLNLVGCDALEISDDIYKLELKELLLDKE